MKNYVSDFVGLIQQAQSVSYSKSINIIVTAAFRKLIRLHVFQSNDWLWHDASMPISAVAFLPCVQKGLLSNNVRLQWQWIYCYHRAPFQYCVRSYAPWFQPVNVVRMCWCQRWCRLLSPCRLFQAPTFPLLHPQKFHRCGIIKIKSFAKFNFFHPLTLKAASCLCQFWTTSVKCNR